MSTSAGSLRYALKYLRGLKDIQKVQDPFKLPLLKSFANHPQSKEIILSEFNVLRRVRSIGHEAIQSEAKYSREVARELQLHDEILFNEDEKKVRASIAGEDKLVNPIDVDLYYDPVYPDSIHVEKTKTLVAQKPAFDDVLRLLDNIRDKVVPAEFKNIKKETLRDFIRGSIFESIRQERRKEGPVPTPEQEKELRQVDEMHLYNAFPTNAEKEADRVYLLELVEKYVHGDPEAVVQEHLSVFPKEKLELLSDAQIDKLKKFYREQAADYKEQVTILQEMHSKKDIYALDSDYLKQMASRVHAIIKRGRERSVHNFPTTQEEYNVVFNSNISQEEFARMRRVVDSAIKDGAVFNTGLEQDTAECDPVLFSEALVRNGFYDTKLGKAMQALSESNAKDPATLTPEDYAERLHLSQKCKGAVNTYMEDKHLLDVLQSTRDEFNPQKKAFEEQYIQLDKDMQKAKTDPKAFKVLYDDLKTQLEDGFYLTKDIFMPEEAKASAQQIIEQQKMLLGGHSLKSLVESYKKYFPNNKDILESLSTFDNWAANTSNDKEIQDARLSYDAQLDKMTKLEASILYYYTNYVRKQPVLAQDVYNPHNITFISNPGVSFNQAIADSRHEFETMDFTIQKYTKKFQEYCVETEPILKAYCDSLKSFEEQVPKFSETLAKLRAQLAGMNQEGDNLHKAQVIYSILKVAGEHNANPDYLWTTFNQQKKMYFETFVEQHKNQVATLKKNQDAMISPTEKYIMQKYKRFYNGDEPDDCLPIRIISQKVLDLSIAPTRRDQIDPSYKKVVLLGNMNKIMFTEAEKKRFAKLVGPKRFNYSSGVVKLVSDIYDSQEDNKKYLIGLFRELIKEARRARTEGLEVIEDPRHTIPKHKGKATAHRRVKDWAKMATGPAVDVLRHRLENMEVEDKDSDDLLVKYARVKRAGNIAVVKAHDLYKVYEEEEQEAQVVEEKKDFDEEGYMISNFDEEQ